MTDQEFKGLRVGDYVEYQLYPNRISSILRVVRKEVNDKVKFAVIRAPGLRGGEEVSFFNDEFMFKITKQEVITAILEG